MNDPTIDRMSRELGTARRWATTMAERVWQLEDAIRRHRDVHQAEADLVGAVADSDDLTLWKLIEGDQHG